MGKDCITRSAAGLNGAALRALTVIHFISSRHRNHRGRRTAALSAGRQLPDRQIRLSRYLDCRGNLPRIMPPKPPNALLHGALDALILKTLAHGPCHGYAIARFIEETTGEAVLVEEGSLYPSLYRMERRGWVEAEWGRSELGRRAKLYRLTDAGRVQLAEEMDSWRRFSAGVSKVLFAR